MKASLKVSKQALSMLDRSDRGRDRLWFDSTGSLAVSRE